MPSISGSIVGRRPVITAAFHISYPRLVAMIEADQELPKPFAGDALIDTGATSSCIDPVVTGALGLEPRGTVQVHTASTGDKPHDVTVVDMSIFLIPSEQGSTPLALRTVSVMETDLLQSQGIHALIGQDVLARCHLVHDGPKQHFTLSWEG